jgi:hypothetical protein
VILVAATVAATTPHQRALFRVAHEIALAWIYDTRGAVPYLPMREAARACVQVFLAEPEGSALHGVWALEILERRQRHGETYPGWPVLDRSTIDVMAATAARVWLRRAR